MKKIFALMLILAIFLCGCKTAVYPVINSSIPPFDSSDLNLSSEIPSDSSIIVSTDGTSSFIPQSSEHHENPPDNNVESSSSDSSSDPAAEHPERRFSVYPETSKFTPIGYYEKYYYINLSDRLKRMYRLIDNAIYEMQSGYIELGDCTYQEMVLAFSAVKCDRPEYFWIPNSYICDISSPSKYIGIAVDSQPKTAYLCTAQQRTTKESEMRNIISQLNEKFTSKTSEYQRSVIVNNWLTDNIVYDDVAAREYLETGKTTNIYAFCAYGGLAKNYIVGGKSAAKAVCEGYSRAYQLLMNFFGMPCILVNGKFADGDHMWNMLKINGEWYQVDTTSNDTSGTGFKIFLNTTTKFLKFTHTFDKDFSEIDIHESISFNYKLPLAYSHQDNPFYKNKTVLSQSRKMEETITNALVSAANLGESSVEFIFSEENAFRFTDLNTLIDLSRCLADANASLPPDKKIKNMNSVGIGDWKGFLLTWQKNIA
ncbi:MAG: hypothetical protein RR177_00675 [Oscillospiraceae bacterium]